MFLIGLFTVIDVVLEDGFVAITRFRTSERVPKLASHVRRLRASAQSVNRKTGHPKTADRRDDIS
jgi:hypothetical protein